MSKTQIKSSYDIMNKKCSHMILKMTNSFAQSHARMLTPPQIMDILKRTVENVLNPRGQSPRMTSHEPDVLYYNKIYFAKMKLLCKGSNIHFS